MGAKYHTLNGETVKKCIRIGKTIVKVVICGGKSSVSRSKIAFEAPLVRRRKNKSSDHKADELHSQMTIFSIVIP